MMSSVFDLLSLRRWQNFQEMMSYDVVDNGPEYE